MKVLLWRFIFYPIFIWSARGDNRSFESGWMKKSFFVKSLKPQSSSNTTKHTINMICSNLPNLKHGYSLPENKTIFQIGETLTLKCQASFSLSGSKTTTCLNNGSFALTDTSCVADSVFCPRPFIPFGGNIIGFVKPRYGPGDVIRYVCLEGYLLAGARQITCQSYGKYSYPPPLCLIERLVYTENLIPCMKPSPPKNGFIIPQNKLIWIPGESGKLVCSSPQVLVGNNITTCLENGSFSFTTSKCVDPVTISTPMPLVVLPCLKPVPPKNGKILGDPYKVLWNTGEVLEYECDPLYLVVGTLKVFCSPDGSFTPHQPICVSLLPIVQTTSQLLKSTCQKPEPPINGKLVNNSLKMFIFVGEILVIDCLSGFNVIGSRSLKCLSDGSFNTSVPICKAST